MESIRTPDDYVIWLQGVFDSIGDKQPSEAEWKMIKERHTLMTGEIVLQRLDKRMYEEEAKRKMDELNRTLGAQYNSQYQKTIAQLNSIATQNKITSQLAASANAAAGYSNGLSWSGTSDDEL